MAFCIPNKSFRCINGCTSIYQRKTLISLSEPWFERFFPINFDKTKFAFHQTLLFLDITERNMKFPIGNIYKLKLLMLRFIADVCLFLVIERGSF